VRELACALSGSGVIQFDLDCEFAAHYVKTTTKAQ
jgi:hypothetical protein